MDLKPEIQLKFNKVFLNKTFFLSCYIVYFKYIFAIGIILFSTAALKYLQYL